MSQPLPIQRANTGKVIHKPDWLVTLRELVRTYQAFEVASDRHIRQLGLTSPQFDVIVTLGNTDGMTCTELGKRTLITKGTLTGVLDRLEAKGLLKRITSRSDRRSFTVKLTPAGQSCFEEVFPVHLAYMDPLFSRLDVNEHRELQQRLSRLRAALATGA